MINFRDWDNTVFRTALASGKPVILSIFTTWCSDCRKMDTATYSSPDVESFFSRNFVAVKVDADKRPDINLRYNQGGFPSTVFLSPPGEVITGSTFLLPNDFLTIAEQALGIYKEIVLKNRISNVLGKDPSKTYEEHEKYGFDTKSAFFDSDKSNFIIRFEREVKEKFDPVYGGFGKTYKFPHTETLRFCLKRYLKTKDSVLLHILEKTLDALCEGALFDHIDGGFFRYSKDQRFEEPSFEKLLSENLNLAMLYYECGTFFSNKKFINVANKTIDFINEWLLENPGVARNELSQNLYYSSVDFKSEYYGILSKQERSKQGRPAVDKNIYANFNGFAAFVLLNMGRKDDALLQAKSLKLFQKGEKGLYSHNLQDSSLPLMLCDQAYALRAISFLFPEDKEFISQILRELVFNMYDESKGGFFDRKSGEEEVGLLKTRFKPLAENLVLIDILFRFGFMDRARKSLIEIFNLYRNPDLSNAPLATFLVENSFV